MHLSMLIMPHLPQVWPSRGRGRELVPRCCPEGWGFCTISVFCDITPHNAIVNGEVHIHIEVINFPLLEVATLCASTILYEIYNLLHTSAYFDTKPPTDPLI